MSWRLNGGIDGECRGGGGGHGESLVLIGELFSWLISEKDEDDFNFDFDDDDLFSV